MADLKGKRYGRLKVLRRAGRSDLEGRSRWWVRCKCGTERTMAQASLTSRGVKSCGCAQREAVTKHGGSSTPEYRVWRDMVQRCTNPNAPNYERYGARGIRVCARWRDSFASFLKDVGRRPSSKHQLDRVNGRYGYSPGNCAWVTRIQNARNKVGF